MPIEPLIVESPEPGILRLRGPLIVENLPYFQNAFRREDAATLIFDLTEVPYVDSSGLGTLVGALVSCQKTGRRLVLSGVNERIAKLFEITKVESLFLIFPTVWDAIEGLAGAGRA